ncbi:MAG: hypothetical protein KBC42_00035 [Candidatus Pacebacteria bacterium]|nr:hypothetical protein [Candidatus Paceibacterota bacterium]MBP9780297.1 hypothetical protein [Candidatus Paceibacterota bacterium]
MKILIIHDGTKRTLDCLKNFAPDFDFDLLECDFAESVEAAETWLRKKAFQQIIIIGESVDMREVERTYYIPYNILPVLSRLAVPKVRILLVSPDEDFLNEGEYLAQGKGLNIERHVVRNNAG